MRKAAHKAHNAPHGDAGPAPALRRDERCHGGAPGTSTKCDQGPAPGLKQYPPTRCGDTTMITWLTIKATDEIVWLAPVIIEAMKILDKAVVTLINPKHQSTHHCDDDSNVRNCIGTLVKLLKALTNGTAQALIDFEAVGAVTHCYTRLLTLKTVDSKVLAAFEGSAVARRTSIREARNLRCIHGDQEMQMAPSLVSGTA